MNPWLALSIEYANQRSYLDDLFHVYPTIPEGIREIDEEIWKEVEKAFHEKDNVKLIKELLKLKKFPIKDSYVSYLRRDKSAIERNPKTINRLSGQLYEMGLNKIYERCSEPKETNRQIGPMFKNWIKKKSLGIMPVTLEKFMETDEDAILDASDNVMKDFAKQHFNYTRDKGIDFIARFNEKYIIGEAKFITDFGGHQNEQFDDAMDFIRHPVKNAIPIAILDGVLYIKGRSRMYKKITGEYKNDNIMSALVLRNFLYSL